MDSSAHTQDALDLLCADHRAVERIFAAFKPAPEADEDARFTLVKRACEQLVVHTMLEEELLYPAARDVLPDHALDVDEARVEHFLVKTLIQRFITLHPSDAGFDATFRVLAEMVQHHVKEEENDLFPLLRESGLDLERLGKRMTARKAELDARLEAAGTKYTGDRTLSFAPGDLSA